MSDVADQISTMLNTLGTPAPTAGPTQAGQPFINSPVVEAPQPPPAAAPQQTSNPVEGVVQTLDGTVVDMNVINPPNLNGGNPTPQEPAEQPAVPAQPDPTIAALQAQLAQQQQMMQMMMLQMQSGKQPTGDEPPIVPQVTPLDPTAILKQEEVQGLVDEQGKLNLQKLVELFQTAGTRSYQLGREHTLRDVPTVIAPTLNRQTAIQATVSTFWAGNQDLQPFRQQLSQEANAIAAQSPHLDLNTVLHQAAGSVRQKLSSFGQATTRMQQMQQNPAHQPQMPTHNQTHGFVPSGLAPAGSRQTPSADNRTPMERQLDEMFNAVG